MPQKTYKLIAEKNEILKTMGYRNIEQIPKETIDEIVETIKDAYRIIEPKAFYKRVEIEVDEKNKRIVLGNGSCLTGNYVYENVKDCDYIIAAIATLGFEIEKKSSDAFDNKDYLKGYAYDSIGICALNTLDKMFWSEMIDEIKGEDCGITKKLSPGTDDWDISGQKIIYELLSDDLEKVKINESFMLDPIKSDSFIYGAGKNIGISKVFHDCGDCGFKGCRYRQEGENCLK